MRLRKKQVDAIKKGVSTYFGSDTEARLFGSRTDDTKKGGDIDILLTLKKSLDPSQRFDAKLKLLRHLHNTLGEQKIDLLFKLPDAHETAFQKMARKTGIPL